MLASTQPNPARASSAFLYAQNTAERVVFRGAAAEINPVLRFWYIYNVIWSIMDHCDWSCGQMDKASVYGTEDSRFDPWLDQ